jgi:hypothetical protein
LQLLWEVAREVGDVKILRAGGQQAIENHYRANRGSATIKAQFEGSIHRFDGVRRLGFEDEVPLDRMTAAVPCPYEITRVAQVDVVIETKTRVARWPPCIPFAIVAMRRTRS